MEPMSSSTTRAMHTMSRNKENGCFNLLQDAVKPKPTQEKFTPMWLHLTEAYLPLGFAAVVLVDESHVTAHCYSDRGWLAIDCFTCGESDPECHGRLHP